MRDRDVRVALRRKLAADHVGESGTLIVDELGLCNGTVRADVAVINGSLSGWEIKSASDTLRRLPLQAPVYSSIFDFVWLIGDGRHIERAREIVPEWWGFAVVAETSVGCKVEEICVAQPNVNIDAVALARLLWREEALEELRLRDLHHGLVSKPRRRLWEALAENLPPDVLGEVVRSRLKVRTGWRSGR